MNIAKANLGRSLELTVIASQGSTIRVVKVPSGTKYLPGGRQVRTKSPVDFLGCFVGSGKALAFDAKQSNVKTRFSLAHKVEPHQREMLIRLGEAGAVAGLLVESVHRGEFLWLPWRNLHGVSIDWDNSAWVRLGSNFKAIDFSKLEARP